MHNWFLIRHTIIPSGGEWVQKSFSVRSQVINILGFVDPHKEKNK